MNPDTPTPNLAPEVSPKPVESAAAGGEQLPTTTPERAPASPESMVMPQGMSLPSVQPPVTPVTTAPAAPIAKSADNDDNPVIADDVDVIEMEWVNQAKKVIKETKDNPHAQEEAVEKLQRDYLKKRYGRDLKKPVG